MSSASNLPPEECPSDGATGGSLSVEGPPALRAAVKASVFCLKAAAESKVPSASLVPAPSVGATVSVASPSSPMDLVG